MLEIISIEDYQKWDHVLAQFNKQDIYYTWQYVKSLLSAQDKAYLLAFRTSSSSMCYPVIVRDIAQSPAFSQKLPESTFFDMETPYGYGGPLFDTVTQADWLLFRGELQIWCIKNNIVSQFIRFHPLLKNYEETGSFFDSSKYLHHTIYMDTSSDDTIMANMDPKNRNMVRKAQKNGVIIHIDEQLSAIEEFRSIYQSTMDYHHADEMYYFSDDYYHFLQTQFQEKIILLKAEYEGTIISSALFFYNEEFMHYHLSGTLLDYRRLASTNLLLYTAAQWAAAKGIQKFHLGGGISEDDSLFGFKKQFNRKGYADYWIGKTVFLPDIYEQLLDVRQEADVSFNRNNNRMIQYRC